MHARTEQKVRRRNKKPCEGSAHSASLRGVSQNLRKVFRLRCHRYLITNDSAIRTAKKNAAKSAMRFKSL